MTWLERLSGYRNSERIATLYDRTKMRRRREAKAEFEFWTVGKAENERLRRQLDRITGSGQPEVDDAS